jgi:hypothetical protein
MSLGPWRCIHEDEKSQFKKEMVTILLATYLQVNKQNSVYFKFIKPLTRCSNCPLGVTGYCEFRFKYTEHRVISQLTTNIQMMEFVLANPKMKLILYLKFGISDGHIVETV